MHNNQFDPQSHVTTAIAALDDLPSGGFEMPYFKKLAGIVGINLY